MGIFQMLFPKNDGTRRDVQQKVEESTTRLDEAKDRFENTIRDMLARHDELRGRLK